MDLESPLSAENQSLRRLSNELPKKSNYLSVFFDAFRMRGQRAIKPDKPTIQKMTQLTTPEIPKLGIMSTLEEDDRRLLSNYGEFHPIQTDGNVITEGTPQDSLYFVISGLLHVHTLKDSKRTLLARVNPGETIGEVNVFDPGVASANVTAQEFTQVWKAQREDIEQFLNNYPEAGGKLLIEILAEMSRRIRSINDKLSSSELNAAVQSMWH